MKRILVALLISVVVILSVPTPAIAQEIDPPGYCWEDFFKAVLYMVLENGLVAEGRIGNGPWVPIQDLVLKADLVTQIRVQGIKSHQLEAISKAAGRPLSFAKASQWLVGNHWKNDFDLCSGGKPIIVTLPQYIAEWRPEKAVERDELPLAGLQPAQQPIPVYIIEDGSAAFANGLSQAAPMVPTWLMVIGIALLVLVGGLILSRL